MKFITTIFLWMGLTLSAGGQEKILYLYNWESYMTDEVLDQFKKETGITVKQDYFASNEELIAKLQAGAFHYDLVVPSDYYVKLLIAQNLLHPLEHKLLSNLKQLSPQFLNPPYDPHNRYSAAYFWGTTGIGVNRNRIRDTIDSWKALYDPKYARKINMLDDYREVIGAALRLKGKSINTKNVADLEKIRPEILAQKSVVRTYNSSTYREILAAGDVWLTQAYSGDIMKLRQENPDIDYVIPKEGATLFTDNWVIPIGSKHVIEAHQFINFILRPEIAASLAKDLGFATPNEKGRSLLPSELKNDPRIYPPNEVLSKLEYVEDVGPALEKYEALWIDLKTF